MHKHICPQCLLPSPEKLEDSCPYCLYPHSEAETVEAARAWHRSAAFDALLGLESEPSLPAAEAVLRLDPAQTLGWLVKLQCLIRAAANPWDEPTDALKAAWTEVSKLNSHRQLALATALVSSLRDQHRKPGVSILVGVWLLSECAAQRQRSQRLDADIWYNAGILHEDLLAIVRDEFEKNRDRIGSLPAESQAAEWRALQTWQQRFRQLAETVEQLGGKEPSIERLSGLGPLPSWPRQKQAFNKLYEEMSVAIVLGGGGTEPNDSAVGACPYCGCPLSEDSPLDQGCPCCKAATTRAEVLAAGRILSISPAYRFLWVVANPSPETCAKAQAADPSVTEVYARWVWQLTERTVSRFSYRDLLKAPSTAEIERVLQLMLTGAKHPKHAKAAFCGFLGMYLSECEAACERLAGCMALMRVLVSWAGDCDPILGRLYRRIAKLQMDAYVDVLGHRMKRVRTCDEYRESERYNGYLDALYLYDRFEQLFLLYEPVLRSAGSLEKDKEDLAKVKGLLEEMTTSTDVTTVMAAKEEWRAEKREMCVRSQGASPSEDAAKWNELREKLRMYPGQPGSPILAALSGVGFLFFAFGMIVGGDGAQSEDEKIGAYIAQGLFLALLGLSFIVSVKRIVIRRVRASKWGAQATAFIKDGKMAPSSAEGIALLEFMVRTVKPIGRFQAERRMEEVLRQAFPDSPEKLQQASVRFQEIMGQASTKYSAPVVAAPVVAPKFTEEQKRKVDRMRSSIRWALTEDGRSYTEMIRAKGISPPEIRASMARGGDVPEEFIAAGFSPTMSAPPPPTVVLERVIQKETLVRVETSGHGSASSSSAAQCARAPSPEPVLQKPVYKDVSTTVACKHCGAPTVVKVSHVKTPGSQVGGVTNASTGACRKCHKMSSYNYDIKDGQFTRLW